MKNAFLFSLIATGVLGACSAGKPATEERKVSQQKTFSAEDKRIASVLSIGNDEISSTVSPQYRATLCSLSLQAIEDGMRSTLSDEQRQAFAQAQALYDQRSAAGLSQDDRERTVEEVEAAYPNPIDRARFAIGCLQDLA
ncbi:hypothetical protein GCM10022600_03030 [Qipengyuania pelagi]|uniref:Lipoprotein n=1 Tax=Qipengyuania pelagi TaxID=994320 RepID=A0A844Y990_9SPHN|nr:hypothetical protein [Qipengyuania pelagi]MXO54685.1 hypothetical protein [Qipengyuania pelagi]